MSGPEADILSSRFLFFLVSLSLEPDAAAELPVLAADVLVNVAGDDTEAFDVDS